MINFSALNLSSENIGPGGLFDFNLTLLLVAIQFIVLMYVLNLVLYKPLLTIIEERENYILTNLEKASKLIVEANALNTEYKDKITAYRKKAQLEIINSRKFHKNRLSSELETSQEYLNTSLENITKNFESRKGFILANLESNLNVIYTIINRRIFC